MSDTKHYYKKKLVKQNLEVEYSSEDDEITIKFYHKLNNGHVVGTDFLRIHPSYIEPLCELLKKVMEDD
jgi:hypothetical protein